MSHYSKFEDIQSESDALEYINRNEELWERMSESFLNNIQSLEDGIKVTDGYALKVLKVESFTEREYYNNHVSSMKNIYDSLERIRSGEKLTYYEAYIKDS